MGTQIDNSIGTTYGSATVLDLGPDGIDAALVGLPALGLVPNLGPRSNPMKYVSPWADVAFTGRQSGRIPTKVTAVTDTRGSLNPAVLSRVFLADHGKPGDSGALVSDAFGKGVGIYLGELLDPEGRVEGLSQHLGQAVDVLNLEIYD